MLSPAGIVVDSVNVDVVDSILIVNSVAVKVVVVDLREEERLKSEK